MSQLSQISALVGFLLPLLVAVVQRTHWSKAVRTSIGVIASIVAAGITAAVQGNLDLATWATSLIFVAGAAYTTYAHVWVPLGAVPWIEKVTTPGNVPERPPSVRS